MSIGRNPQLDSLGFWIFRLNRVMFTSLTKELAKYGVTGAEWTILAHVSRGITTPVSLSLYMQIDRAAVSRFLFQLERKRLILRKPHPADRRSAQLALSPEGKKLLPKLRQSATAINERFLASLALEERETLIILLRKVGESLPHQFFLIRDCLQ